MEPHVVDDGLSQEEPPSVAAGVDGQAAGAGGYPAGGPGGYPAGGPGGYPAGGPGGYPAGGPGGYPAGGPEGVGDQGGGARQG